MSAVYSERPSIKHIGADIHTSIDLVVKKSSGRLLCGSNEEFTATGNAMLVPLWRFSIDSSYTDTRDSVSSDRILRTEAVRLKTV